jgi:hypothetical protein
MVVIVLIVMLLSGSMLRLCLGKPEQWQRVVTVLLLLPPAYAASCIFMHGHPCTLKCLPACYCCSCCFLCPVGFF